MHGISTARGRKTEVDKVCIRKFPVCVYGIVFVCVSVISFADFHDTDQA